MRSVPISHHRPSLFPAALIIALLIVCARQGSSLLSSSLVATLREPAKGPPGSRLVVQTGSRAARQLLVGTQSAPYAIESGNNSVAIADTVDDDNNASPTRCPQPRGSTSATTESSTKGRPESSFVVAGRNGSVSLASTTGATKPTAVDIKSLLETFDENGGNYTGGEVKLHDEVDDGSDGAAVNTTISISPSSGPDAVPPLSRPLLDELMVEAGDSSVWNLSNPSSLNAVVRDNHRYESRHPPRSKLTGGGATTLVGQQRRQEEATVVAATAMVTAPPIRSALEVVAENYTTRKIAEEANVFAIKLLHQLNAEAIGSHNLVQAPFAVYQGLTLLLSGAMGETAKELDRVLLGSQSAYENTRLTHDQDRTRLSASLNDVVSQLRRQSSHHLRPSAAAAAPPPPPTQNDTGGATSGQRANEQNAAERAAYHGGTAERHLITANNLLFSPGAFEVSSEFKSSLAQYYTNTVLTKVEVGSTESIHTVNSWIRHTTRGVIPSVFNKRNTFDEYNVLSLLCTSWLAQEWKDHFYRVSSSLKSSVRLKEARRQRGSFATKLGIREEPLLEFVDDGKGSHFVEYIKSRPTKNIHHYHSVGLNGLWVDLVVVPFLDSNHRFIAITPMAAAGSNNSATTQQQQFPEVVPSLSPTLQLPQNLPSILSSDSIISRDDAGADMDTGAISGGVASAAAATAGAPTESPDSSPLTKLIAAFAANARKGMRSIWNIVAPEIITKQTLQRLHLARQQQNVTTADGRIVETHTTVAPLVQLSIPILRTEADSSISPALNHIGIVNAFDPGQANFIGINGHPFNYYELHLSNVLSKTTFNLNERGINYDKTIKTLESMRILSSSQQRRQEQQQQQQQENKASGAGDIEEADGEQASGGALVDDVQLNKPFMYLVVDVKTRLVLYSGVVRNPAQERAAL